MKKCPLTEINIFVQEQILPVGSLGHKMQFPTKFLLVLVVRKQLDGNILMVGKLDLGTDVRIWSHLAIKLWHLTLCGLDLLICLNWLFDSCSGRPQVCAVPCLHVLYIYNFCISLLLCFVFRFSIIFCILSWQAVVYQTTSMPLATQEDVEAAIAEVKPTQP